MCTEIVQPASAALFCEQQGIVQTRERQTFYTSGHTLQNVLDIVRSRDTAYSRQLAQQPCPFHCCAGCFRMLSGMHLTLLMTRSYDTLL